MKASAFEILIDSSAILTKTEYFDELSKSIDSAHRDKYESIGKLDTPEL